MARVRMDIKTIVVGGGPVTSLVILSPRTDGASSPLQLPIRIGPIEAAAIGMGVGGGEGGRPITHDLLKSTIDALGAKVRSVVVTDVRGTTFFAQVELERQDGRECVVDARPSDAIALAVRTGAPILAEQAVIDTAAMPDFDGVAEDQRERSMEEFHSFVENLSPDDFA